MTSHVARLYALSAALLLFVLAWVAVSAWASSAPAVATSSDPRVTALKARERALVEKAARARVLLAGAASATPDVVPPVPRVQIASAPPVTVTRSS
jgi:hypothetical protein